MTSIHTWSLGNNTFPFLCSFFSFSFRFLKKYFVKWTYHYAIYSIVNPCGTRRFWPPNPTRKEFLISLNIYERMSTFYKTLICKYVTQ